MGSKYDQKQAKIDGLDSKTKFEMLRKSNQVDSSYNTAGQFSNSNKNQHISLEQIREKIF